MGTDIHLQAERRCEGAWRHCGHLEDFEVRHYEFFAILANVRNPIRSEEPFAFIAPPRGLPEDLSEDLRADFFLHCADVRSWLTLRELLDFDWDRRTIRRSAVVLDPSMADLFGDGKQPFPHDRITGPYALAESGPGPRVTWVDTYRDAVGAEFLGELFETLARFGPPDDVRIIFSFDS